jgi:hypothetical protein
MAALNILGIGDEKQGDLLGIPGATVLNLSPPKAEDEEDPAQVQQRDALAKLYNGVTGMIEKAKGVTWDDVTAFGKSLLPTGQSLGEFGAGGMDAWADRDIIVPEGAEKVMLDTGPAYKMPDGTYKHRDELPRRGAVVPLSREDGKLVASVPGVLGQLPALGAEGGGATAALTGAAREGAEGVVLGAGSAGPRAARVAAAARRLEHEIPPPHVPPEVTSEAFLTKSPEAFDRYNAERGSRLDEGVPTRSANLGTGREGSMMGVPNLRNLPQEEAVRVAQTDAHLIPKADGGYVGAPADVTDAASLTRMREQFDLAVERGMGGSDWYQRAQDWIKRVSGGDPVKQRQLAEKLGITSPQSNPESNLAFTITGHNAQARGIDAETTRTGAQARQMNEANRLQEDAMGRQGEAFPNTEQGLKTGPFTQNLDPTAKPGTTGVNDIWHARSFGYTHPDGSPWDAALSTQQHVFMDYETMQAVARANAKKLGGRDNWTAAEIQAAPWVANKAADLRRRFPGWSEEKVWEEANATFPDRAQRQTASVPHEQEPGSVTGLTRGTMSPKDWTGFANWRDPNAGNDVLLGRTGGLLSDRTQTLDSGVYVNAQGVTEYNPVHVAQSLLDLKPLPQAVIPEGATPEVKKAIQKAQDAANAKIPREVHPASAAFMDATQAARGVIDMQEGNPWTYVRTNTPGADANSVKITLGRQPTSEEMQRLHALADKHEFHVSNTADGVALIDPDKGRGGADVSKLLSKGGLEAELRQALPGEGVQVQRGVNLGGYVGLSEELDKAVAGEGRATRVMMEKLDALREQAPRQYERLLESPEIQAKARLNLARLQQSGQLGVRPDYEELLRLLAEGRMSGLQVRIARQGYQGLPAVGGHAGLLGEILGASGSSPNDQARYPR